MKYAIILPNCFSSLICQTPIIIKGHPFNLEPFFNKLIIKKIKKSVLKNDQLVLLEQMLAKWQHPVAFSEALDLLHLQFVWYCTGALPWPSKWPVK
jgi:hypothetical protein